MYIYSIRFIFATLATPNPEDKPNVDGINKAIAHVHLIFSLVNFIVMNAKYFEGDW